MIFCFFSSRKKAEFLRCVRASSRSGPGSLSPSEQDPPPPPYMHHCLPGRWCKTVGPLDCLGKFGKIPGLTARIVANSMDGIWKIIFFFKSLTIARLEANWEQKFLTHFFVKWRKKTSQIKTFLGPCRVNLVVNSKKTLWKPLNPIRTFFAD